MPSSPAFGFFPKCHEHEGMEIHYYGPNGRCQCGKRTAASNAPAKPHLRLVEPKEDDDAQ